MRISDWSSDVCSSDLLIGGVLMIFTLLYARAYGYGKQDGVGKMPVWRATSHAGLALFMPVVILGGIYGGIFTPTEASVVAVFYARSEEHTSELQSLMRISYAVFCLKKKKTTIYVTKMIYICIESTTYKQISSNVKNK